MRKLKFGTSISNLTIDESVTHGILADKNGFDYMWVADHINTISPQAVVPEVWITLTAISMNTRKVRLGTGVTDVFRRHPSVTAQVAATLDDFSGGRAVLGIGTGDQLHQVPFGINPDYPVSRLRETIEILRLLWASTPQSPANYVGKFYQLRNAFLQIRSVQKPHVPIYLGAMRPRMREMVGELADGWFPYFWPAKLIRQGLLDVERGARKAGRNLDEIDTCAFMPVAISKDYDLARKVCEPLAVLFVMIPEALKELGYEFTDQFTPHSKLDHRKFLVTEDLVKLMLEAARHVPFEAVEKVAAVGSTETCIRRITEYVEAGATQIIIRNLGPDVKKTYEIMGKKIIPYFEVKK